MSYQKGKILVTGTISTSSRFNDIEVDICNEVLQFLGHDNFTVHYDVTVKKTIDGKLAWYEIVYEAWG